MREVIRRLLPALLICLGLWLIMYVSFEPLLGVRPVDFKDMQAKAVGGNMTISMSADDQEVLAQLPPKDFVAGVTAGKVAGLTGPQGETFFADVAATLQQPKSGKLSQRLGDYDTKVYFKPDEQPFSSIGQLAAQSSEYFLRLGTGDKAKYLLVQREQLTADDLGPMSGSLLLPSTLVYPYRHYGYCLIGLAIGSYIFLPWPKVQPDFVGYPRWQTILGDAIALLLLFAFFALPLLVTQGSVQAITSFWPLTAIMWLLAAGTAWLLWFTARYGGVQIGLFADRLRRISNRGQEDILFSDISHLQPVALLPPRWLIRVSWLAVLIGNGDMGAAGRALIISGTRYNGIQIICKDGRKAHIWLTNQLGGVAMPGFDKILAAMRTANIPMRQEVVKTRGFGID